ncbi:MAG: extracellular solute-binding protein [Lachnospiraceae bacterium]|nr:extracellular solute-binding protein [Lachnospiraceae bacterium]
MKKRLFKLFMLLAFAAILCAACASKEDQYDDLISEGKSLSKKEKYSKAEEKFEEAIKLLPEQADAYIELYKIYVAEEDYDLAKEIIEEGLDNADESSQKRKLEKKLTELEEKKSVAAKPTPTDEPGILDYVDNSRRSRDIEAYNTIIMYVQVALTDKQVYTVFSNAREDEYIAIVIDKNGTQLIGDSGYCDILVNSLDNFYPTWKESNKTSTYTVSGYDAKGGYVNNSDTYEIRISLGTYCNAYKTGLNPYRIGDNSVDLVSNYSYIKDGNSVVPPVTPDVTPIPYDDGTITLTMWDNAVEGSADRYAYDKALQAVKSQYPNVRIEESSYEYTEYKYKLKAAAAANELPDIFYTWTGAFLEDFVAAGRVRSLDDKLKQYLDNGSITEAMLENSMVNGMCYSVPVTMNVVGLFANMDMLAEVGYDHIPTTKEELYDCCDKLVANGYVPFGCAGNEVWCVSEFFEPILLKTVGADELRQIYKGFISWNSEGVIEALDTMKEMINKGYFAGNAASAWNEDVKSGFMKGEYAFYQNGTWNCGDFDYGAEFNMEVGEWPVMNPEKATLGQYIGGATDGIAVSAKAPDLAAEIAVELGIYACKYGYSIGAGINTWKSFGDTDNIGELVNSISGDCQNAAHFVAFGDIIMPMEKLDYYLNSLCDIFGGEKSGKDIAAALAYDLG